MEVALVCSAHKASMNFHELLECYNVSKEEHYEEDPRNVKVLETEGEHAVEGIELEFFSYTQPTKKRKVNIGMTKNPKFVQI
jgi:hypothetical protein